MKLKDMTKKELEALSYTDLTELVLREGKKSLNTPQLFHTICDLLEYGEDMYEAKIGDYYTSLTTDKRFILLENGLWDLKEHHAVKIVIEEDTEEELDEMEEENLENEDEEEDTDSYDILDDEEDLDDDNSDLDDLTIIGDDEDLDEE